MGENLSKMVPKYQYDRLPRKEKLKLRDEYLKESGMSLITFYDKLRICRRIEDAAGVGFFKTSFLNILPQDKTKLEMLGFTVLENPNDKFPYTVSWE